MAKRRRLAPPDALTISRLGVYPDDETRPEAAAPPIARVVGDAAAQAASEVIESRVTAAANEADAARWRAASAEGLVAESVPLSAIDADHLSRDRVVLDDEEMAELRVSIRAHGLRMPVEVLRLDAQGGEAPRYGLISGWRRLKAVRALWAETGEARFAAIKALVRTPENAAAAYVAMVEENEVRADLTHYERGRVCVVAAGQGAFGSTDEAVLALFASASKAKRSKIRSFALIHEELGDLLAFAPEIGERAGLRLAAGLRAGAGDRVRQVVAMATRDTAEDEWAAIEAALQENEAEIAVGAAPVDRPPSRGERGLGDVIKLANGITMEKVVTPEYVGIRLKGRYADRILLDAVALEVERLLMKR